MTFIFFRERCLLTRTIVECKCVHINYYNLYYYYICSCCCMNGLAMGSMLSAGHTSTTVVPLHTTSPRFRVSSVTLKGSSGSERDQEVGRVNSLSSLWAFNETNPFTSLRSLISQCLWVITPHAKDREQHCSSWDTQTLHHQQCQVCWD